MPLDSAAEAQRAQNVEAQFGKVAPSVVQYTTEILLRELWLRPDLVPRDRSLARVSALVASGQMAEIPYHLNRAMNNGLIADEAGEAPTQLAFYAGWPRVFAALPVMKDILDKRRSDPPQASREHLRKYAAVPTRSRWYGPTSCPRPCGSSRADGGRHGNQSKRGAPFQQRAGRLLYRRGAGRSPLLGAGSGTRQRCASHL